jgi:LacI family transcriptional regulator
MSDVFLRRLTPGLSPFVQNRYDYSIIDIQRPLREIRRFIAMLRPEGLITEMLPIKTAQLLSLNIPTVITDSDRVYSGHVSIDVDDWKIGEKAASHFAAGGFRHFAFFGNTTDYSRQRQKGFVENLKLNGFGCSSYISSEKATPRYMEFYPTVTARIADWLTSLPKPVGLFAAHDPLGRLASEICRQSLLAIPEEVAIVGANNDELICNLSYPPLSSVGIPWTQIGKMTGELMERLIRKKSGAGRNYLVEPESVIVRESSNLIAVSDPQLRRALEYMREHYQDPINLKFICGRLKINRRSLELKFRKHLSRSPRDEIVRLRIEKAKSLLLHTNREMEWIAEQSGFTSAERLSVVFSSTVGLPPAAYRRTHRTYRSKQSPLPTR